MKEATDKYWALEKSRECVECIFARAGEYNDWLRESGRAGRMLRAHRAFYGSTPTGDGDSSLILQSGEQGELADLVINHFASLVRQTMVLVTQSKPTFKAVAENTDSDSLAQASLADGLVEHYDRVASVSGYEYLATFSGVLLSEGCVAVLWNPTAGKPYGIDPDAGNAAVPEGDIEFVALTPFDTFYDIAVKDWRAHSWLGFRRSLNRWDLIAQYPDKRDDILAVSGGDEFVEHSIDLRLGKNVQKNRDRVEVCYWFHKHTTAVPKGRMVVAINPQCILFDSMVFGSDERGQELVQDFGLPYDELPVYEIRPDSVLGTCAGHAGTTDLLGLQQAIDMVGTVSATSIDAAGLKNFWCPNGDMPSVRDLGGGLKVLSSQSKPEVLASALCDPEVLKLGQLFVEWQRNIAGLNDVAMGQTEKGMPAQLAALMEAKAIQYHSRLQADYTRLIERVRSAIIKLLKRYAKTERVALVAGKANTYKLARFTSQNLSGITEVSVEQVNPIMRTYAGKKATADELLAGGHITARQYIAFITSGRIEPMFEGEEANLLRIRREKELLQQGRGMRPMAPPSMPGASLPPSIDDGGEYIVPIITDTHWLDIPEYASVLAMPDARAKSEIVTAVTELIAIKLQLWQSMPPILQLLMGCPTPLIHGIPPMSAGPTPNDSLEPAPPQAFGGPAPSRPPRMPAPPPNPLTGAAEGPPIQ